MPDQSTFKYCCVNTDDGLSWRDGNGTCANCIGKRKYLLILYLSHDGCGVSVASFWLVVQCM